MDIQIRGAVWRGLTRCILGVAWMVGSGLMALSLAADSDRPILEYSVIHHMLVDRDPTPLLRVYADGRTVVHFPAYMQRAGAYELELSPAELQALITDLDGTGLMDVRVAEAQQQRRREMEWRRTLGNLPYVSESTETVIELRLDKYRGKAFSSKVRWSNVYNDVRHFPGIAAVQAIARAERRLTQLMDSAVNRGRRMRATP